MHKLSTLFGALALALGLVLPLVGTAGAGVAAPLTVLNLERPLQPNRDMHRVHGRHCRTRGGPGWWHRHRWACGGGYDPDYDPGYDPDYDPDYYDPGGDGGTIIIQPRKKRISRRCRRVRRECRRRWGTRKRPYRKCKRRNRC